MEKPIRSSTKIKPVFDSNETGYDIIFVTPTHLNRKHFKGFSRGKKANANGQAIGPHELDNHHGTSFHKSEENILFIMFKLKQNMSLNEVESSLHKYFWFEKTSKAGNQYMINGKVVYLPIRNCTPNHENPNASLDIKSTQYKDTKELRINGCNYEISKMEIRKWIDLYGEIKSKIQ